MSTQHLDWPLLKPFLIGCAVAFALIYGNAEARSWTEAEKGWAAAAVTFTLIDWAQTRHIARNPDRWRELNPLLPQHPTLGQVNRHFIRSIAAGAALVYFLPEYRLPILKTITVVQFGVTARNAYLGIRMEF